MIKNENEIRKNEIELLKKEITKKYEDILNSKSFVIGNFIVKKIKIFRRFWKK
ncbi:hypothetical protein D3C86_2153970 [compost metagenome]